MIIDANVILRYIRDDIPEQAAIAETIILNNIISLPYEVLTEVIYVLETVYNYSRTDIYNAIFEFINLINVFILQKNIVVYSLEIYKNSKLDIVDCILCAYKKKNNEEIFTFDNDLNKMLSKI
jgi:predicted nucleic-acid-binding protein